MFYLGQTDRKATTGNSKRELATGRRDSFSPTSVYRGREGHEFNLDDAKTLNQPDTWHPLGALLVWYSPNSPRDSRIEIGWYTFGWEIYNPANGYNRNSNHKGP